MKKKLFLFVLLAFVLIGFVNADVFCDYYLGKADEFFSDGLYDWGWDVLSFLAEHYPHCL